MMTIQQVLDILEAEKQQQVPSRFHCRAIFVANVEQYINLIKKLRNFGGISVISSEELFSGPDVMPNYNILTDKQYQDKWVILPGVSEYLRLFHSSEESAQRFGSLWHFQSDANSKGRIIIPLWGCDTLWHDEALGLCDDLRQVDHVFECTDTDLEPQKLNIQVLSGDFEQYVYQLEANHGAVFCGLKEWYDFWCNPQDNTADQLILTRRFRSIKPTDGDIHIHVIRDTISFIRENLLGGTLLSAENCPKEAQDCLFTAALRGKSVDEAILSALNSLEIRPVDIMGKWAALSKGQRQLVFLWYSLHPDDTYLCHCVKQSDHIGELPDHLLTAIFPVRVIHPDWISESQALIAAIPIQRNDNYFAELDKIPSREERLDYLTVNTARERIYILHLVGQWMRDDPESVLQSEKLKELYPALSAYLEADYPDEELNIYFEKYKTYKLSNTLPQDQESYFSEIDPEIYYKRYPLLYQESNEQTVILWIDALGIEWMPLLKWALERSCDGKVTSVQVAQANLPSETCYNEQWKQMNQPYEKYDKLDKLAHKGVIDDKDYYACVDEQLQFVHDITDKVNKLLKQYARVLITGDHGTSRLAARAFHKIEGLTAPLHSEVGSHGRYCKISGDQDLVMDNQKKVKESQESEYLVFSNYDHYKKPGFAAGADDDLPIYGEIHGGASPEEMLVPVITVDSKMEIPLSAKWTMPGNSVKISNKRAKCRIQFSRPVSVLKASMDGNNAECSTAMIPSKDWTITFSGMKLDKVKQANILILADGIMVNMELVEIKPALGGGDPF